MNTRTFGIFIVALTALAISACDQIPGKGASGTAVIDLAEVAEATGQQELIQQRAAAARERLEAQLRETAAKFEEQLELEREKLGESPSDEAQQKFQQLAAQAQQQFAQLQQQAQQQAQQFEANLVMELREKIIPLAEGIARARGVAVVFLADITLFWSEPHADITDEVIEKLLADPSILAAEPETESDTAPATEPESSSATEPEPSSATEPEPAASE